MDYHIHTKASPDARGTMEEYIGKAQGQSITEIGFSDHVTLHHVGVFQANLSEQFMQTCIQDFLVLKEKSELPIKLGAEIDFFPEKIENIREFIQRYPFDYAIGAVHFVGHWMVDSRSQIEEYKKRDMLQVYEEYFGLVQQLCACQLFDSIAHVDLIKIFGFKPRQDFSNILKETAEVIAKSNVCVEINASGLRRPCAEIYPSEQFLRILHSHDVPIVFGSDAHEPNDVGRNFKEAVDLAKKVGYAEACTFDHRAKNFVKFQY